MRNKFLVKCEKCGENSIPYAEREIGKFLCYSCRMKLKAKENQAAKRVLKNKKNIII